jgi:dCMP deaminase
MGEFTRPDWDEYFLAIAKVVAKRADCSRRQVGAVIVQNNRIVATGYNGAAAGQPGCGTDGACPRAKSDVAPGSSYDTGPGSCIAIHAEANALLYADRGKCEGSTIYCTEEPCGGCLRLISGAGIGRVVTPADLLAILTGPVAVVEPKCNCLMPILEGAGNHAPDCAIYA